MTSAILGTVFVMGYLLALVNGVSIISKSFSSKKNRELTASDDWFVFTLAGLSLLLSPLVFINMAVVPLAFVGVGVGIVCIDLEKEKHVMRQCIGILLNIAALVITWLVFDSFTLTPLFG